MATAANLSLALETREQTSPLTAPQTAAHEESLTGILESSQTLRLHRPDRLAFTMSVPAVDDQSSRLAPTVNFDGRELTIAEWRDKAGRWRGKVGDMRGRSVDDVLKERDLTLALVAPVAGRLASADAETFVSRNATDWTWLGDAHDSAGAVWRVGLKMPLTTADPAEWEFWLSQAPPHRIVRVITRADDDTDYYEPKPGADVSDDGVLDMSKMVTTHYRVRTTTETRFTACDVTTPLSDTTFVAPVGDYRKAVYREAQIKLPVGATAELSPLKTADGHAVDFTHRKGPVVLDFWFAACGPCRYWTPQVEALVDRFRSSGMTLYGVNGIDSPDTIKVTVAREGWRAVTLVDADDRYTSQFDVSGYPTVIVLDPAGKVLYRQFPGEPGAMAKLEQVLHDSATAAP